jgi:rod shape-determining protein MreC
MRRVGFWASLKPFIGPVANAVFAGLIILSLVLVLSDDPSRGGKMRGAFDDTVTPAFDVMAAPFRGLRAVLSDLDGYTEILAENRALREENARLRQWYALAAGQQTQMRRYEALLGIRTDPPVLTAAARVVAETGGPFVQAKLANAGAAEGVSLGQAVITEHGLMGRIVGVGQRSSRILLLTDAASRVPVMVARTDARGLLTGDNVPNPRMDMVRGINAIMAGDLIMTSGDGGLIPRGLPVGQVYKARDGAWRVKLFTDRGPGDYVKVLQFTDLAALTPENNAAPDANRLPATTPLLPNPAPKFAPEEPTPTPLPPELQSLARKMTPPPVAEAANGTPAMTPDPFPTTPPPVTSQQPVTGTTR